MEEKTFFEWLKSLLSEKEGKMSMVRFSISVRIVSYSLWGTWIVVKTDLIPDIPVQVAGLLVMLYGLNRAPSVFGKKDESSK